jgi:hypothetical protein
VQLRNKHLQLQKLQSLAAGQLFDAIVEPLANWRGIA